MPENQNDINNIISTDTNNLITSLLLFGVVAKTMTPNEINITISGAADTIIEQLSKHFDKYTVEKIVIDVAENIKDNINSFSGPSGI